jgi:hypothetical protein
MSQANLALLADRNAAQQVLGAGGVLPDLAAAAAAGQAEELKKIFDSAKDMATTVLQSATAKTIAFVDSKTALESSLKKVNGDIAEVAKAREYFNVTQNIFPLMKVCGIPVQKDILTRSPGIDKIPEGWTAPAASAATSA